MGGFITIISLYEGVLEDSKSADAVKQREKKLLHKIGEAGEKPKKPKAL